jgi:hypothetical protein
LATTRVGASKDDCQISSVQKIRALDGERFSEHPT